MPSATKKRTYRTKVQKDHSYWVGRKRYRGRTSTGRVSFKLKENSNCIELAKRGLSHQCIADTLSLTRSQVSYRLGKVGVSVMDYRRGDSEESRVILKKFKVTYRD